MTQRFFSVLGNALEIGLETTVQAAVGRKLSLAEGFSLRDPNARGDKPECQTVSVIHPAVNSGANLPATLLSPVSEPEIFSVITFRNLPPETPTLFRRLNLKQAKDMLVLGMACGRAGEAQPFPIRQKTQPADSPIGYVNLDFLSKTSFWNPLYVKYRLNTPLEDVATGYLWIDAGYDENQNVRVTVKRVPESEVPEVLKTAETFPK